MFSSVLGIYKSWQKFSNEGKQKVFKYLKSYMFDAHFIGFKQK